jgi:cytochrome c oxidase assembly protein subunit 15
MIDSMSVRLARFAWGVVAWNVAVILWGAYVRASGSGAGCGAHWPLCDGAIVPRAPSAEMLIEYSHRLTSGLALLAVVALLVWTRRVLPSGHPARRGAALSMAFMLTEAGVGAGLVLFQLVADNASLARAMFMAVHLANTFLLLASLTLTAHWTSGGADVSIRSRPMLALSIGALATGVLLVSVSGAVAALGDTLFPASSLRGALLADLSPASHVLIRLRVLHPALAIGVELILILVCPRLPLAGLSDEDRHPGFTVAGLAALQIALGFTNVILLAPVWMQLVHLLVADILWMQLVRLSARALAEDAPAHAAHQPSLASGADALPAPKQMSAP